MSTAVEHYVAEAEHVLTTRPVLEGTSHDALLLAHAYLGRLEEALRNLVTALDAEADVEEEAETLESALADLVAEHEADYHDAVRSGATNRELAATERRHEREVAALRARFDVEPAPDESYFLIGMDGWAWAYIADNGAGSDGWAVVGQIKDGDLVCDEDFLWTNSRGHVAIGGPYYGFEAGLANLTYEGISEV
jgi:hypothetical protein